MEVNKFDNVIKEKFANRTFTPSESAWDRLEMQLDAKKKPNKKPWILYVSIAASIALLISLGVQFLSKSETENFVPKEEYVVAPEVKKDINNKIDEVLKAQPTEMELVSNDATTNEKADVETKIEQKSTKTPKTPLANKNRKNEQVWVAQIEKSKAVQSEKPKSKLVDNNQEKILNNNIVEKTAVAQKERKTRITINAEDLLYSVTHTPEEMKAYYSKNNINRDELLNSIKKELKKSKIKMNPETLLTEVEQSIFDDNVQNNFLNIVKERVTLLASAIANRNN